MSDINLHTSVKIALLYKKHFGRQNKWKHFHIFISHNKKNIMIVFQWNISSELLKETLIFIQNIYTE